MMETDEIHVTLQLSQSGNSIPLEDSSPNIHIDDAPGHLKVYVPKKGKAQDVAFSSVLPRRLLWWLMDYPDGRIEAAADTLAINALNLIFHCEVHVLDEILDRQGILQVHVENKDEPEAEYSDAGDTEAEHMEASSSSLTVDAASETETLVEVAAQSHMARDRLAFSEPPLRPYSLSTTNEHVHTPSTFHQRLSFTLGAPTSTHQSVTALATVPTADLVDKQYRSILERVVSQARAATFPSIGSFDLNRLRSALFDDADDDAPYCFNGTEVANGFRSATQIERDKKVGAAGELYVRKTDSHQYIMISNLAMAF